MPKVALQVNNLCSRLDIVPFEGLCSLGAADTLHGAEFWLAAHSYGADAALVFEQLGNDGAGRRAHSVVQLSHIRYVHVKWQTWSRVRTMTMLPTLKGCGVLVSFALSRNPMTEKPGYV